MSLKGNAMNDEIKKLVEDAARLLGIELQFVHGTAYPANQWWKDAEEFNPLAPECGDLMKVAMAAKLIVGGCLVSAEDFHSIKYSYPRGDYDSLALAVLRAASAVLKAREGE